MFGLRVNGEGRARVGCVFPRGPCGCEVPAGIEKPRAGVRRGAGLIDLYVGDVRQHPDPGQRAPEPIYPSPICVKRQTAVNSPGARFGTVVFLRG